MAAFFISMLIIVINSAVIKAEVLPITPLLTNMEKVFRNISGITMTSCLMTCSEQKICCGIGLSEKSGDLHKCHLLKDKDNATDEVCGSNILAEISTEADDRNKEMKPIQQPAVTDRNLKWILQSDKVCFGAKDYGQFNVKQSGKLVGIKLSYLSGSISYQSKNTRWGTYFGQNVALGTLVTNENNKAFFPPDYQNSGTWWYYVNKTNSGSEFLPLYYPKNAVTVMLGNKLRIWFTADWHKLGYHGDDKGKTCAKVFASFVV